MNYSTHLHLSHFQAPRQLPGPKAEAKVRRWGCAPPLLREVGGLERKLCCVKLQLRIMLLQGQTNNTLRLLCMEHIGQGYMAYDADAAASTHLS